MAVLRKTFQGCQRGVSVQMRVAVDQADDWYEGLVKYYKATTECEVRLSYGQEEKLLLHERPQG
jgi:hypothetical protein